MGLQITTISTDKDKRTKDMKLLYKGKDISKYCVSVDLINGWEDS